MRSLHSPRYRQFLKRLQQGRREAGLTQVQVASGESGERRVDVVELADFAKLYRKPITFFPGGVQRVRARRGVVRAPPGDPGFRGSSPAPASAARLRVWSVTAA